MTENGDLKVVLVQMPWATPRRPSIAFGILAAICEQERVACEVIYPNVDMAFEVGLEVADLFADERALFGVSEHLFAVALFGREALQSDHFLDVVVRRAALPAPLDSLAFVERIRDSIVPAFLDRLSARVLRAQPDVVGFSSPFNQVMASLALAARLKRAAPGLRTIFGGACFDGEMGLEYHRAHAQVIDHVFMGEAEESFREYLRRMLCGEAAAGIAGVTFRTPGGPVEGSGSPALRDMDSSPTPDYRSFFAELDRCQAQYGQRPSLSEFPFESSRGCWWGQKNHCMFCGLNEQLMGFRSKSTDRVVEQIIELVDRYRVSDLIATDWIVSRTHRSELFKRLEKIGLDVRIFYETRSDMSKEEIGTMFRAGVRHVQPGIESLSTPLLRLMRKGATGIRQLQFLRWAAEYGVRLSYTLLAGFPGEQASWYLEMAELIPSITHLQPPLHGLHFVEMHRYSPLFDEKQAWNVRSYSIRRDYNYNFPIGLLDLNKVGYSFEFDADGLAERSSYEEALGAAIAAWRERHASAAPIFRYEIGPSWMRVVDTRVSERRETLLSGIARDVLLLCDEIRTRAQLNADLEAKYGVRTPEMLASTVEHMRAIGMLYEESGKLLSLPIGTTPRTTAQLRALVLGVEAARRAAARRLAVVRSGTRLAAPE